MNIFAHAGHSHTITSIAVTEPTTIIVASIVVAFIAICAILMFQQRSK